MLLDLYFGDEVPVTPPQLEDALATSHVDHLHPIILTILMISLHV